MVTKMNNSEIEILVVDDDLVAANAFAEMLKSRLKLGVEAESDPEKVLILIKQHRIKVVVLDQRMPSISGTELYKRIRSINPYVKAIMLTGEAERNEVAEAMDRLGYAGYLEKVELDQLHKKVITAMAKYESSMAEGKGVPTKTRMWIFNPRKNRFFTIRYDILNIEETSKEYIFPDGWITRFTLDADEKSVDETLEFSDEIIISEDLEITNSTKVKGTIPGIPTFTSELDNAITKAFHLSGKHMKKHTKSVHNTYKLQENIEKGKTAIKKVYESAPVYSEYEVLIRKTCRICGATHLIPLVVYKRRMTEATRVTIYYEDSTSSVINTGYVSL